jgi:hypothetical protein
MTCLPSDIILIITAFNVAIAIVSVLIALKIRTDLKRQHHTVERWELNADMISEADRAEWKNPTDDKTGWPP